MWLDMDMEMNTTTATGRKASVTWAMLTNDRETLWDVVLDGTEVHCLLTADEVTDLLTR